LVTHHQPMTAVADFDAAQRQIGGFGAGASLTLGAQAGPYAGDVIAPRPVPNFRSVADGSGSKPASRIHNEQTKTQIDPVTPGGVGPHPVREPGPA
jgi:hypothetical protein